MLETPGCLLGLQLFPQFTSTTHLWAKETNPPQSLLKEHTLLFTQEITAKLNALFIHIKKQKALPLKISQELSHIFRDLFKITTFSPYQVGIL